MTTLMRVDSYRLVASPPSSPCSSRGRVRLAVFRPRNEPHEGNTATMSRKRYSDTGPFALVPEWVLELEVSDRAVRLYALLARYADDAGEGWPARRTLAERLRCSLDTLDRAKDELVDAGALEIEHRTKATGEPTSNLYRILRVDPAAALPLRGRTDAATSPQACPPGSRTGAAQNESHEREPMNEADSAEGWKPGDDELEAGRAAAEALFAKRDGVRFDAQDESAA